MKSTNYVRNLDDVISSKAGKEIYRFWNNLPENIKVNVSNHSIESLILAAVKDYKCAQPDELRNLYKVTQIFPGSYIAFMCGMPILTIVKSKEQK